MSKLLGSAATLDRVKYRYPSAEVNVVDDESWVIEPESFTVVAGSSGSGKSTQLRLLNGLVPHFTGGQFGGRVLLAGRDTRHVPTRDLSREVGFVFQEPDGLSIGGRVDDEVAFGLEQIGVPVPMMRRSVEEVLTLLGIEHLRSRSVSTLSGGERQRVAIAAAMAVGPRLLVLDEPTSQLDPAGADDVVQALRRLNEEHGITIVLSEHRLERVVQFADCLRVLFSGDVAIDGLPRDVLAGPGRSFAPSLFKAGQRFGWSPLPLSVKEGRGLLGRHPLVLKQIVRRDDLGPGSISLTLESGELRHEGNAVLKGADVSLRQGDIVALMGPNGSGKTTLLRSMIGLHPLASGSVTIGGAALSGIDKSEIGKIVGFLPQRARTLLFNETVHDEVAFSLHHRGEAIANVSDLLDEFDLAHYADRHPFDLSVGEQERLALASVLAGDPPVLLLDEPTRGLDLPRKQSLAESLQLRARKGQSILVATHDVEFAAALADRVLLLGGGEIISEGTPHEVFAGSLVYGTQINKVFGSALLTLEDLEQAIEFGTFGDNSGAPE